MKRILLLVVLLVLSCAVGAGPNHIAGHRRVPDKGRRPLPGVQRRRIFHLTVVVEPHSFTVDSTGKAAFRKLDPGLHVELSSTSFRLAPKQTYYVFYKATTETYPNWFTIYATISGRLDAHGFEAGAANCRIRFICSDTNRSRNRTSPGTRRNCGARRQAPDYGPSRESRHRVRPRPGSGSRLPVTGKQSFAGFPLFPGQRRDIEFDWDQPGTPKEIVLRFSALQNGIQPEGAHRRAMNVAGLHPGPGTSRRFPRALADRDRLRNLPRMAAPRRLGKYSS